MKLLQLWIAALVLSCVCRVADAGAAATITVTPAAEGVYNVTASNVVKAASLDFTVTYDVVTLSNPVITDGPFATAVGAMQIPNNDATRGTLRVVYVTTIKDAFFNGGGLLATVSFTKTANSQSRLPKLKAEVISVAGTQSAVQSIVTQSVGTDNGATLPGSYIGTNISNQANRYNQNSGNMGGFPNSSSVTTDTSSGKVAYQSPISGSDQEFKPQPDGSTEEAPLQENQQINSAVVPDTAASAAADKADNKNSSKTKEVSLKELKSLESVAERFRIYKGVRSLKEFSKLFDDEKSTVAGVSQTPKIAVSDGKKMISVKITLPSGFGVPSFSLKGANLKGLKNLSASSLELDALPQKGKLDVRMSILFQKEEAEIPLLVVPPISTGILELSDQELEKILLNTDAKNKTLPYDLNSDGKQDYLDDYTLVAHWLLKQQNSKKAPAEKAVVPR